MTYLELVAAVGSVPMDIACMYFNGRLTEREMKNVIGWKKAGLVREFDTSKLKRIPQSLETGLFFVKFLFLLYSNI